MGFSWRIRTSGLAAAIAVASALLLVGCDPPPGTDYAVDSTLDLPDASPGNGVCRAAGSPARCTLRAAIQEANADGELNDLVWVPNGTYPLATDLEITTSLQLRGESTAGVVLDPSSNDRAITVTGNVVSISRLTMAGASLQSTNAAGGFAVADGSSVTATEIVVRDNSAGITGGGIRNDGILDLRRSEVRDNTIGSGAIAGGGVTSTGGGIYNTNVLRIDDSTIAGNESSRGGGIANLGGDVDLKNSTVSGNVVYEGGGGIYNTTISGQSPGEATVDIGSSTITLNEANHLPNLDKVRPWGGGILNLSNAQVNIGRSVVAENIDNRDDFFPDDYSPDCYSLINHRFHSYGSTVIGILTDTCGLHDANSGDLVGISHGDADDPLDPGLGSLGSNGGATRTHSVLSSSPLIDGTTTGSSNPFFGCPAADQRGIPRPLDGDANGSATCDIGATEYPPIDDGDGVAGAIEDTARNFGDGNDDGIPDKWQPTVASLSADAAGTPKVTFVVSGSGERIDQLNTIANPDPATDPARFFPIGFFNLDVVAGPDGEARVTILLPTGVTATQWWNYGPEPGNPANHWWSFVLSGDTGLSGFGGVLTLDFVDGQRGDRGGTVNGRVTNVGGAARSVFCETETATIIGTDAVETINGTGVKDVIVALGGGDTVNGLGGDDVICGGDGGDTIDGGAGNDVVHGEKGGDDLSGGSSGADRLLGEDGTDELSGGSEADLLYGGTARDILNGGGGNDDLFGQEGNDDLFGNDGNDDLDGGPGFDLLRGGPGADTVINGEDSIP